MTQHPSSSKLESFSETLAEARKGCKEAHDRRYRWWFPILESWVHGRIHRQIRSKYGDSDLFQDTALSAFENLSQFRGDSENGFLAWLHQIMVNRQKNVESEYFDTQKRDVRREVPLEDHLSTDNSSDSLPGASPLASAGSNGGATIRTRSASPGTVA